MAKRGVLDHPKTLDLAERLGIPAPFALGVLEAFWHWTAKYHPNGDIGGTRPGLLALSIRYEGDGEELLKALRGSGWIDRDSDTVHDWREHADDAVHMRMARGCELFADGCAPRLGRISGKERERIIADYRARYGIEIAHEKRTDDVDRAPAVRTESAPPEPEPEPEPEIKTPASAAPPPATRKPAHAKRQDSDPRFGVFRQAVVAWWVKTNRKSVPWDGSEQSHLAQMLAANPDLSVEDFRALLETRGASEVNLVERPRAWLATITNYANGPLDRFGKPLQSTPKADATVGMHGVGPPDPEGDAIRQEHFRRRAIERRARGEPLEPWEVGLLSEVHADSVGKETQPC